MNENPETVVIQTTTYRVPDFSSVSGGSNGAVEAVINEEVANLRAERNEYLARISGQVIRTGASQQFIKAVALLAGPKALDDLRLVMPEVFVGDTTLAT